MTQTNAIAGAIFVGFLLVAAAIFFSGNNPLAPGVKTASTDATATRSADPRFIYGEANAKTTIVEFSDYECPFCARVHPTLKRLVDESNGTVNWEYRHLPLSSHQNAFTAAVVGECVGRTIGNDAFWSYSDTVFANQKTLSTDYLRIVGIDLGLSERQLDACLADEKIITQVKTDALTAAAFGGRGTPFSVIIFADGTTKPVSGALPYENWQEVLNIK